MVNILFVCKHNRFRSKVAEAIFKKFNKKHKLRSRAVAPDYIKVAENVQKALRELGYKRVNKNPKKLTKKDLSWADLIVIVANNVNVRVKNKNKKIIKWKIKDTSQSNYKEILKIIKIIEKRIKKLVYMLRK